MSKEFDKDNLWVVGQFHKYEKWDLIGIFSDEDKAIKICQGNDNYFIGPCELDKEYPKESSKWDGLYYPNLEDEAR